MIGDIVPHPCRRGETMVEDEHNTKKFPTKYEARQYLAKHKLTTWELFGLMEKGFEWFQVRDTKKADKPAPIRAASTGKRASPIKTAMIALYAETNGDKAAFMAAALDQGVKGSSAITYWYDIKAGRVS